jgi:hypothetical protein
MNDAGKVVGDIPGTSGVHGIALVPALDRGFTQSMFYSQAGSGEIYSINQDDTTRDIFTGAVGLRTRFGNTATLDLEYSVSGTPSRDVSWLSQMVRATGHWNFEAN